MAAVDQLNVDVAAVLVHAAVTEEHPATNLTKQLTDPVQDETLDTLPNGWTKNGSKYKCPTCK